MIDHAQLPEFRPTRLRMRAGWVGRRLALLGLASVLALPCPAVPPNPFTTPRHRKEGPALAGDSHVPGFPATPARLTREYVNAFMQAEVDAPDEARMLHAFKHPDMGLPVVAFLPRYYAPGLIEPARKLARSADPAVQSGAISGLISLLDTAPETLTFVRGLLLAPNPVVRGRAAEYLCWLGGAGEYAYLTKSASIERDVHARAAMVEAAAAIKRRATLFGDGAAATLTPEASPADTYQQLADVLAAQATAATRLAVIARLRTTEVFEPIARFSDRLEEGERGASLLDTHRLLAGYPLTADMPDTSGTAATHPVAKSLIAPVRDYFDARRKSYGILIEGAGDFGGKYHVGDDVAWKVDHETVVAIGDGIVRRVDLGRKSWGGLVVVEHVDAAGARFCSLYGHLGPLVCVHPGQIVRQGDKLGVVGPSYTYANGGYLSHLHFGIHRSAPGEDGTDWACGYLTPEKFNSKTHGWVEPQEFIRSYRGR